MINYVKGLIYPVSNKIKIKIFVNETENFRMLDCIMIKYYRDQPLNMLYFWFNYKRIREKDYLSFKLVGEI